MFCHVGFVFPALRVYLEPLKELCSSISRGFAPGTQQEGAQHHREPPAVISTFIREVEKIIWIFPGKVKSSTFIPDCITDDKDKVAF